MKPMKETHIFNVFNVETLVGMYYAAFDNLPPGESNCVSYDFCQLVYVDSGLYNCRLDGVAHTLSRGQLIFCKPHSKRVSVSHKELVVAIISFRCNSEAVFSLPSPVFTLSDELRAAFSEIFTEGITSFERIPEERPFCGVEPKDGVSTYELQSLKNRLELFLLDLCKAQRLTSQCTPLGKNQFNHYERQLRRIEEFLYSRINHSLTTDEISAQIGLSKSTIKRVFSHTVGCGVIHYFNRLKIKEAKRLICETDMHFSQISDLLGFSDIHCFSKAFKKATGLSPRAYAASVLKDYPTFR